MGAVTFSLDEGLLHCLKGALPLTAFVETGTFKGDAVAIAAPYFERIVTVEFSAPLWEAASKRFAENRRVEVLMGDSAEVLARIGPSLGEAATLFWLDAHWCVAENTAGDHSQCPLLGEIAAIGRLGESSVILIDDARLFLAPPPAPHDVTQWPTFDQIVLALRGASTRHELMVVNDVIVFYPQFIKGAVEGYARRRGVDWLRARQSLEENTQLRTAMEEKEALIHEQHQILGELRESQVALGRQLAEKEGRIQAFHQSLEHVATQHAQIVADLEAKEAVIRTLDSAVRTSEAQHQLILGGLQEKESVMQALAQSLQEKETLLHLMNAAGGSTQGHLLLVKGLDEKEAVIQELSRALEAYRSAFSVLHLVVRPLARIGAFARSVTSLPLRLLAPRLGNLNQHAPIELCLPPHYSRRIPLESTPRISIVTPSFNQGEFIERTIRSVLDQAYPNLEYHVQDGASGDGTRAILERYSGRLAGWDSSPDSGQTEAINRGFARTTGEIMAWLNSDDVLLPGALAYVADFFNRHPDVDVVYGHRALLDEKDRQIGRWILPAHSDAVLSWADYVPQETLFWRRRIWDKAGGRVDESFRFAMDWDLLVRFRDAGARFERLPRFLGGFRIHPQQKTSASMSEIGFTEMNRIRERALGRVPTHLEISKAVLPYLMKHCAADFRWRLQNRIGVPS
jgi:GT2 family glycosyltransferase